ncbi:MAG TPA: methyltransferase domain-containing protein [Pyrinomonadaceae bacterium]|jgi:ubiquinone/menaquinone biosynthesis C-methylase UbiE|nr:methyltransferase domain-containing protein [Pyrinomonadaceae bacterium]
MSTSLSENQEQGAAASSEAQGAELIDVRQLMAQSSIEELNRLAEEYFSRLTDWNYHLSKPFGALDETPQLLINFAVILQGLSLCPGMTVLEFGAGTGWASRFLSQLGCRVIAVDVSETALRIGAELFKRQPVIGDKPAPLFLKFDGYKLDLPGKSVDRIMCLDAFHHVPNPSQVLSELSRVLKDGGIAGFAEPGPEHSKSPQSQYEMKTFKVVENDVNIHEIWMDAQAAGFTKMKLALFNVPPFHLEMEEFEDFLQNGPASGRFAEAVSGFMQNQRNFFLYKGEPATTDSRFRTGLSALITITPQLISVKEGETINACAVVTNNSPSVWLPRGAGLGAVHLGCHVYLSDGTLFRHSYHWEALTPGEGRPILPNETIETEVAMPALPKGQYLLEFDMVSNDVCWFALNGSQQVRVAVEVL